MARLPFNKSGQQAAPKKAPRKRSHPDMSAPLGDIEDWLREGIGLLSILIAWIVVRRVQPKEVRDEARNFLAMTDEEAAAIADPAAKIFERSALNKRWGKAAVRSNDYVKLGIALYDYGDRIWPFLKHGVTVHVVNDQPAQPVQAQAGSNGHNPGPITGVVPIANAA